MRRVLVLSCALIVWAPLAIAQEAQTLKERLSDKASDAQRVDNCPPRLPREASARNVRGQGTALTVLRLQSALCADIERVDRRAAADEQTVPERPAKA
jgi:hypothetical protein